MLPIVELPEIVRHYSNWFEPVFSEEALVQFQRYISGLLLSENKTVEGINRIIVHESRSQSSLNRLLTASPYDEEMLNEHRLSLLASLLGTQLKPKGVLSVDDTHLVHYGKGFDEIAILWDPVTKSYVPAHNLVNLHYSDDQTDYPIAYQLWKPANLVKIENGLQALGIKLRANKFALKESAPGKWRQYILGVWSRKQGIPGVTDLYESKLLIARRKIAQFVQKHPELDLPVTFDNWYTQPGFCRYLDKELKLSYVGTLAGDDEVVTRKGNEPLKKFVSRLKDEHLQAIEMGKPPIFRKITIRYKGTKETYYTYCRTMRIHNFGKQRLVINFSRADLSDSPRFFNSNRLHWQAPGITRIRRHRWPVEVYHQEGKAEGLDQYQVRNFQAISRHIGLVAVTYSLLRAVPHDHDLLHKLQLQLKFDLDDSAPALRRAASAQSLWSLASLIADGLAQGHSLEQILTPILGTVYA